MSTTKPKSIHTDIMLVLVYSDQETEPEINYPGKKKENTSWRRLDVLLVSLVFSRQISFWFRFLLTVNKYYHR